MVSVYTHFAYMREGEGKEGKGSKEGNIESMKLGKGREGRCR